MEGFRPNEGEGVNGILRFAWRGAGVGPLLEAYAGTGVDIGAPAVGAAVTAAWGDVVEADAGGDAMGGDGIGGGGREGCWSR